ncbi:phage head closure protein [Streptomyces sp. NPDC051014]|uniref:phage head closure protein n=1 Tax=Streptomyces sp. NPDC051014 TaxID=3155751 RepID=UPI003403E0A1
MTGSIGHLLNRTLEVWRPAPGNGDGLGGRRTTYVNTGRSVQAKVDQPSDADRILAQQAGSEHTHTVYLLPGSDVTRGDQLRGDGQVLRVTAAVTPSSPVYLKAPCTLVQSEPG